MTRSSRTSRPSSEAALVGLAGADGGSRPRHRRSTRSAAIAEPGRTSSCGTRTLPARRPVPGQHVPARIAARSPQAGRRRSARHRAHPDGRDHLPRPQPAKAYSCTTLRNLCSPRSASVRCQRSRRRTRSTSTSTTRASPVAVAPPRRATTDPSSIVFNPGGIAIDRGHDVSRSAARSTSPRARTTLDGDEDARPTRAPSVVPNLYITSRVHDMVAVGIGLHLPFGLARVVAGRATAARRHPGPEPAHVLHHADGRRQPQQAGARPRRSAAASDIVPATIELEQDILFGDTTGTAHLGGDTVGFGVRAGVHVSPARGARAQARRDVPQPGQPRLQGQRRLRHRRSVPRAAAARRQHHAEIELPQTVSGGAAYSPVKNLEIEVNAVWINWAHRSPRAT